MNTKHKYNDNFSESLIIDCARSFYNSTSLPCTVSTDTGEIIAEFGYGVKTCNICEIAKIGKNKCQRSHIYAASEATRFGGKYIYLCLSQLTFFASPIIDDFENKAKITVGPFLMVEVDDYTEITLCDELSLENDKIEQIKSILRDVPYVSPDKIRYLSNLLFMAVGFINNITDSHKMLELRNQNTLEEKSSVYIHELKSRDINLYPFDVEEKLLDSIIESNHTNIEKYLNEILGHIFLASGGNLSIASSMIIELLSLVSRAATKVGADSAACIMLTHDYLQKCTNISSMEGLTACLLDIITNFTNNAILSTSVGYSLPIQRALRYVHTHYSEKITLKSISEMVYLSPDYFGKIFKKEIGVGFNKYLNDLRIERCRLLLRDPSVKFAKISLIVGFEDQSYFTKVFKKQTGMTPLQYRKKHQASDSSPYRAFET